MSEKNNVFAVIDTNVVVSALLSKDGESSPAKVISKIFDKSIIPIFCDEILREYYEVLSRPRFPFSVNRINDLLAAFRKYGVNTERVSADDITFPDPDDAVFFEVKMSVDDAYLVTGNLKHFPTHPQVVTPAQMIEILNRQEQQS